MTKSNPEQNCFVISPIGQAESDIRKHADKVLNYIIKRSLEPLGYNVIRADAISEPGTINLQVTKRIVDSEMVVADLTGTNPNVMYELAIRHAIRKPVILLIKSGEKIPFDIASERTIFYDLTDVESVAKAQEELVRQAQYIQEKEFKIDTPFSLVEGLLSAPKSSETEINNWTIALDDLGYIKNTVKNIWETSAEINIANKSPLPSQTNNRAKIGIEIPNQNGTTETVYLEISSEHTIAQVLNRIYFILRENRLSMFSPAAFTYLWRWILVRKTDNLPLFIKGIQVYIHALEVFNDGETWQVLVLDEPLLNKPERIGFYEGYD